MCTGQRCENGERCEHGEKGLGRERCPGTEDSHVHICLVCWIVDVIVDCISLLYTGVGPHDPILTQV